MASDGAAGDATDGAGAATGGTSCWVVMVRRGGDEIDVLEVHCCGWGMEEGSWKGWGEDGGII